MKRITKKEPSGTWNVMGIPWTEIDNRIYGALCKLKDYEDTGLSPNEVERLNTFDGSQAMPATAKLQAEQRKNRWISVLEQLPEPEDDKMKLVSCKSKNGTCTVNRAYYLSGTWHGSGSMSSVMAWMPLPEPYSEDN